MMQAEKAKVSEMSRFQRIKKTLLPAIATNAIILFPYYTGLGLISRYDHTAQACVSAAYRLCQVGSFLLTVDHAKNAVQEDEQFPTEDLIAGFGIGTGLAYIIYAVANEFLL